MSRCFPYPPPGYCRNGATTYEALIESIKLQKETDKAKAERRKEKREKKEKKEKKKERKHRKNDEKVKVQNNQSEDSHKLQQKVAGFTDAQIKGTKTNTEERSDLTEEHGQPIKPCYSSDSTQNSNKRRRDDDDVALPDDSTGHGKPIKILILKKHKGSHSSNSGEDLKSKTVPLVQSSNLDRTQLVSNNRNNGVPATSGRENNAVQGIPSMQTKSSTSFERTKSVNSNGLGRDLFASSSAAKPVLPSGSRMSNAELLKSTRQQQQIANFVRPVLPQSHLQHEIPSSSLSRNIGVQGLNSGRQQQGPGNLKPGVPVPVLNKQNPSTTGKRPINEISIAGPSKLEKKKEHSQKTGPTRHEKKMLKKQAKYEKLIGSWVPPVLQALVPDVGDDEDWLSRTTKSAKSSLSRGEVETCREVAPASLWQPQARFLAEADIHALPYTVPF